MILKSYKDLITTPEQTRAGFVSIALKKSDAASPYIEQAKVLHTFASQANQPEDLLNIPNIRMSLLTACGLSDKAINYFTEDDRQQAIQELINKILKPAGEKFVEELVYRFLLIKGDSLGGAMRNIIGKLSQDKLILTFISTLAVMNIPYRWFDNDSKEWKDGDYNNPKEDSVKAIQWHYDGKHRVLAFNLTIKTVDRKNVDLCLFNSDEQNYNNGGIAKDCDESAIMFGELKGGIDPAGADEHWKTAITSINRIRRSFSKIGRKDIKTAFVGAAIEEYMAKDIFTKLRKKELSCAANLNVEEQVVYLCEWIIKL